MRRLVLQFLVTGVALASTKAWSQPIITAEQAADAVRAFESDSTLQFGSVSLEQDTAGPTWSHKRYYTLLLAGYEETNRSWNVDAYSAEVTYAYHGDDYIEEYSGDPIGPLTVEDCRQVAESYARARYAGFESSNLAFFRQTWVCSGWKFEWRQLLSSGAWGISSVTAEIDPRDGTVQSYSSDRVPIPTIRQPVLTVLEAIQAAQAAAGVVTLAWVQNQMLTSDPDRVYWSMELGGTDSAQNQLIYFVSLDAQSGEILEAEPARADPGSPLVDWRGSGSGLVHIRARLNALPHISVNWLATRRALILVGNTKYLLRPGSCVLESSAGNLTMSRPAVLEHGRLLVPPDIVELLEAQAKVVSKAR